MKTFIVMSCALCLSVLVSCVTPKPEIVRPQSIQELQALYLPESYEHFVAAYEYPKTLLIYRDSALLKKVSPASPIYICLDQQRGRIYVEGKVAMDWPVSTGVNGRKTPTGNFRVLEKKAEYASNMYGVMYDADGKRINGDAKSSDEVPEGGKFVPSPMPYWQRLTQDGIGMHIGRVVAGRRLSHGCIRTPRVAAKQLFDVTTRGKTRVYVVQQLEPAFYNTSILEDKKGLPKTLPTPEQLKVQRKTSND